MPFKLIKNNMNAFKSHLLFAYKCKKFNLTYPFKRNLYEYVLMDIHDTKLEFCPSLVSRVKLGFIINEFDLKITLEQ